MRADPNTKLVAMGDAFDDRISSKLAEINAEEEFKGRVDVPSERAFARASAGDAPRLAKRWTARAAVCRAASPFHRRVATSGKLRGKAFAISR